MSAWPCAFPGRAASSDWLGARSLTHNSIGGVGAAAIAQALPTMPKLEKL